MKIKNKALIYPISIIAFLLMLIISCKKDDENPINQTNGKTTAVFNPNLTYGTMTDQDGNIYKTISIGTQTWMAENLRTTKYRNGDAILNITSYPEWSSLTTGNYCNYRNTSSLDTISTFGRYYNWFAVSDIRNIAPKGWHVPSDAEWLILINYLGGDNVADGKLKEIGNFHWLSTDTDITNESGFTALPGVVYDYYTPMIYGIWWSSTESETLLAWTFYMACNNRGIFKNNGDKTYCYSVRCLKD